MASVISQVVAVVLWICTGTITTQMRLDDQRTSSQELSMNVVDYLICILRQCEQFEQDTDLYTSCVRQNCKQLIVPERNLDMHNQQSLDDRSLYTEAKRLQSFRKEKQNSEVMLCLNKHCSGELTNSNSVNCLIKYCASPCRSEGCDDNIEADTNDLKELTNDVDSLERKPRKGIQLLNVGNGFKEESFEAPGNKDKSSDIWGEDRIIRKVRSVYQNKYPLLRKRSLYSENTDCPLMYCGSNPKPLCILKYCHQDPFNIKDVSEEDGRFIKTERNNSRFQLVRKRRVSSETSQCIVAYCGANATALCILRYCHRGSFEK